MKHSHSIIVRPLITERATILAEDKKNPQYVFKVATTANKIEIRRAVEDIFNVKVKSVNTVLVKGKLKRQGRTQGKRSDWKKALVTLQRGQAIEVL